MSPIAGVARSAGAHRPDPLRRRARARDLSHRPRPPGQLTPVGREHVDAAVGGGEDDLGTAAAVDLGQLRRGLAGGAELERIAAVEPLLSTEHGEEGPVLADVAAAVGGAQLQGVVAGRQAAELGEGDVLAPGRLSRGPVGDGLERCRLLALADPELPRDSRARGERSPDLDPAGPRLVPAGRLDVGNRGDQAGRRELDGGERVHPAPARDQVPSRRVAAAGDEVVGAHPDDLLSSPGRSSIPCARARAATRVATPATCGVAAEVPDHFSSVPPPKVSAGTCVGATTSRWGP